MNAHFVEEGLNAVTCTTFKLLGGKIYPTYEKVSLSPLTYPISFLHVTLLWDHTKHGIKTVVGRGQPWQGLVHYRVVQPISDFCEGKLYKDKGIYKTQETETEAFFVKAAFNRVSIQH